MLPFDLINLLERAKVLDRVGSPVQDLVRKYVRPQGLRDALHGVPIGHPAHPPMVQVPIGAWLSAVVLDQMPGTEKGADALIGLGLLTAVPAATAGLVDWSELNPRPARVGLVHLVFNSSGVLLFLGSLVARRAGNRRLGRRLALVAMSQVGIGGVLGGHLSFHQASGANHTADVVDRVPSGWRPVCDFDELPDGAPVRRTLGDVPVLVLRSGTGAHMLAELCAHLSGPLSEGEITGPADDPCVVCPWHGSTFRLSDGSVVHGPATAGQPVFDVRVREGQLEARLR